MDENNHDQIKRTVLDYVRNMFDEMEQDLAMSHQEKYALLEDAFENASEPSELRIAFEQWYADHADEVDFGYEIDELWDQATGQMLEE